MRLLLVLLIASCTACATPYAPQSFWRGGGFSDTRLAENIFDVRFTGNDASSEERVVDFGMLRSAELCLDHGYSHFLVAQASTRQNVSYETTPIDVTTETDDGETITVTEYETYTSVSPSTHNRIVCLDELAEGQQIVYDAWFVQQSIREKYELESRF